MVVQKFTRWCSVQLLKRKMALIVNEEEFIPVKSKSKKRKLDELTEDNGNDMDTSESKSRPNLPPISGGVMSDSNPELRKIPVPANRYTPIKDQWRQILVPLTEHLKLKVRFNLRTRNIELATYKETSNTSALQKGADFVKALTLGFEFEDAMALIRLDDLYLETFDVTDVKPLKGDHLSRAVGRIAGKGGKTKFTIENMTKTRIVLANTKVHILGAFQNVRAARRNISSLILGSKSTSVYGHLRVAAKKLADM